MKIIVFSMVFFLITACNGPKNELTTATITRTYVATNTPTVTATITPKPSATHKTQPLVTTSVVIPTITQIPTSIPTPTMNSPTPYINGGVNCPGSIAIMYHHIYQSLTDSDKANVSSDIESFKQVIEYLVKEGYYFPTTQEFAVDVRNKVCRQKYAIITIDDSWNDPETMGVVRLLSLYGNGQNGLPKAWLGVVTKRMSNYRDEQGNIIAPWKHLLDMQSTGLVCLVSHSQTHPAVLTNINDYHNSANDDVYGKVASEAYPSRMDFLNKLNIDPLFYIYPGGNVSIEVVQRMKPAGYVAAFTVTPGGIDEAKPYLLPRINGGYGCGDIIENNADCVIEKIEFYSQSK